MTAHELANRRLVAFDAKCGAEIEKLYVSGGHPMSAIGSKLSCSVSLVERVLKFRKVKRRRPGNWIGRRISDAAKEI